MAHPVRQTFHQALAAVSRVVLDKEEQILLALSCVLAGGHLLIEGIPGTGKTSLAQGLARVLGLSFARIQCTADMLPGDVIGFSAPGTDGRFVFHQGPVFTHLLLADELNRAMPKTQSALLEAMAEEQVSVEGVSRPLPTPFFVIATQNPLEHAGTFPLPDSQLDRFLMRISLGYPAREAERGVLTGAGGRAQLAGLTPLLTPEAILTARREAEAVHLSPAIQDYLLDLLAHSRREPSLTAGLSTRAGLALTNAAKALAYLHDRDAVLPEDVQEVLLPVAAHRLRLAETGRPPSDELLARLFSRVPVDLPRAV